MAHEAAHLQAYKKYKTYTPPGFQVIWETQGGDTPHGDSSSSEGYAVAVERYVHR